MIAQQNLFEAAEARAKAGMEAAAEHAERVEPDWGQRAFEAFRAAARIQGGYSFTVEEVRLRVEAQLPQPPDRRAWGAVVQRAIRAGWLRKTGIYAPRASGNGTPTMTYTYGGRP